MLILTRTFLRKELKPLKRYYNIESIKKTASRINPKSISLGHLGYKNGKLLKLRMANRVAGRMIVYIFMQKNYIVPIILRLKKDKLFGRNISLDNRRGKKLILQRMNETMTDIKNEDYQKI